ALAHQASLARRQPVQAEARCDRVEPRRELRVAAELGDGSVDTEKDLLRELFGFRAAAQHPERHAEDAMLVGDHQLLEGSRLAPPEPVHQVCLIARPPFHPVRPYRPPRVPRRLNSRSPPVAARCAGDWAGPYCRQPLRRRRSRERTRMLSEEGAGEVGSHWGQAWYLDELDGVVVHHPEGSSAIRPFTRGSRRREEVIGRRSDDGTETTGEPRIVPTREGYDLWSQVYDDEDNPLITLETALVERLLGDVRGLTI